MGSAENKGTEVERGEDEDEMDGGSCFDVVALM